MVKRTVGETLAEAIKLLKSANIENAAEDARVILSHVLNCDKLHLTVNRDVEVGENKRKEFLALIEKRAAHTPVSYLTGTREFMSIDFDVSENVLIPRPDTEILVERAIEEISQKPLKVLDMCTGSGAIGISVAKYAKNTFVTCLDISEPALETARRNAKKNRVDDRCFFENFDVMTPYHGEFDVLLSNPPYIPSKDIADLESDVKDFEPKIALDGGYDGLDFYRQIVKNAPLSLKRGGFAAFETGCGLACELEKIMSENFENIEIIRDLSGIERVVCGYLK